MGWDVIVIKLTTDTGIEGIATCMAARSGAVSESYLQETVAPVVLGRDPHDREAIFQELWVIDRHEAFFPVFLPGPVDVALWDICAKEAGLPLYKYIGAYRDLSLIHILSRRASLWPVGTSVAAFTYSFSWSPISFASSPAVSSARAVATLSFRSI